MTPSAAPLPPSGPLWRREPYRLLFPLGVVLGQVGVLHWLLYAVGASSTWRSFFHALSMVQGFMLCFALGFLFTFVPRRTGTAGPSAWQLGASLLLPVLVTASAWGEAWRLSQLLFLAQLGVLLSFVVPRILSPAPGRVVPEGMVWVPLAIGMGAGGSLLTALPVEGVRWLHSLGTGLLLQGLFAGLVLGVGGMLLPMFLHGQPPSAATGRRRRVKQGLHLVAALLFVASFVLELRLSSRGAAPCGPWWSRRPWWAPRSCGARPRRRGCTAGSSGPPAGCSRWGTGWWRSTELRTAGLHVVFLGCFALMALAVSVHVVLAHGGHGALLQRHPWQVAGVGGLVLLAMTSRLLMSFVPAHFLLWLGGAAAAFLGATLLWGAFLLPLARGEPASHA